MFISILILDSLKFTNNNRQRWLGVRTLYFHYIHTLRVKHLDIHFLSIELRKSIWIYIHHQFTIYYLI
jgi:hypothetical protein